MIGACLEAIGADKSKWTYPLELSCALYEIDSPARVHAFLAQCAHESNSFARLEENLVYSPKRLMQVWPARFTPEEATRCAFNGQEIAEKAYGGRLGNNEPGDGWKYRGRGILQITGKANYRLAGRAIGVPLLEEPERLLDPMTASCAAAWFWAEHGCNELADRGAHEAITRAINGGRHGLEDRLAWVRKLAGIVA